MKYKKIKLSENTKDILFMIWGFIGAGICFNLIICKDLGYLKNNLLRLIAQQIGETFIILGFVFVVVLVFVLGTRKIIKIYEGKNGRRI